MKILRNLLSVILVHNTRSRARAQRHLWRENLLQFECLERRWAPAVTFGVIGDYGVDNSNELAVANLVKSWNPDFVITTGDNGYNTTAADIDRFIGKYYQQFIGNYQGSYGPGAGAVNKFFPSAGNHDWDGGGGTLTPYTNYFTLPGNERYYDFVRGDVHFFVVSSDSREPDGRGVGSVQRQWLQSRLAASTAPWQVVYMHHPPYSSAANHGSTAAMQWPYQQWGADVVLAAHDHTYERIIRNDANNSNFPYFVNGTGGNSLYSFSTPVAGSQVRYSANWGAMRVTADATRMTFEFINVAGNVIDTYAISNAALPAVNIAATDANASEPGANTGAFTISRTGPTTNPLTVNYTRGGTATNAADYAALSGTVVIPAGAASAVITLTPLNDALVEGSETAILTLSASAAYTIGASSSATVTIADDDVASLPTVTIAATDANAAEPANTGTFTVSRTGSTTAAMTVNYTVNGTATRGSDYTNLSGVVTIPAGAASAAIIVTPINDTLVEANETVLLALAAGAGYAIGSPNNATVTIADNDAPPTPEIVVEGNSVSIADGDTSPSSADHTDFGAATVGGAPISRTFTIRNAGTGPLNVGQVTVPAGFTLTSLPASNVAAGGTTQFTVRLETATAGTKSGDVSFNTNDSNENPFNFRITGTVGTGSAITSFTLINADTDGAIRTIANGDTINLAGLPTTRLNIRANTNAGPIESVRFGFDGNNNYRVENLPPYALFSDQAGNYHAGTLSAGSHTLSATPFSADNAGGSQGVPLSIAFSVINSAAPPEIVVLGNGVSITDGDTSPSSADHTDFGAATVGGAPISRTFTIRNAGTGPLNVGQVTVPAGFTVTSQPASNVAAGGTTQFTVRLETATAGTKSGDVSFNTNDSNENPFNFRITGTVGTGSAITSFTLINADTDGAIRTIANGDTINLASLPTTRLNIRANTNAGPSESVRFGFDGNNNYVVENLPPYALFSDQAGNYHAGTLSAGSHTLSATPFSADNAGGSQGVPLSIAFSVINSAAPPEIVVLGNGVSITDGDTSPSSADHTDFGAATVGGAPISRTFTIRNAGTGPLNVGQVTVPAGFTVTSQPASNVAAGGTTQFTVRLETATAGTKSGDVSFNTNDSNENPFNFRITGTVGTGSAITSFTLINADTDGAIRTIANGDTINLAGLPTTRLNIRANTNAGPIESVRFGFDGNNNYVVENLPPYALFSDQAGNYHAGTLSAGSHTLSATPFSADNAGGNVGIPLTISFTVVNSGSSPNSLLTAVDAVFEELSVGRRVCNALGVQESSLDICMHGSMSGR